MAWLGELFASEHRDLRVPIGDDAAVLRARGRALVATTAIDPLTGAYGFTGVPADSYDVVATDGTATATLPATVTGGATTTIDLTLP